MIDRQPVFILGMPRCRTAWLSVCLTFLGIDCTHGGMLDFRCFDDYAADLNARLQNGPAGDSEPALLLWLDDLLLRWPGAQFVVVSRDVDASRRALAKASNSDEATLSEKWPAYAQAFFAACDRLRARSPATHFVSLSELENFEPVAALMHALTGRRPDHRWARRMHRLYVGSLIEPCISPMPPQPKVIDVMHGFDQFDVSGLQAAVYENGDFLMVAAWWESHNGRQLAQAALPPLGVVVSHEGVPWAAIWCYELYGVPIAELTFPVTKPELSLADASRALMFAALACMSAAGKAHVPEARFTTFKVVAPRPMIRFLKRLGFEEYLTERVPMMLTLT